ncbi:MAG: ferrous iron transport protein A [Planctomycetales bacterium]|nr:ferrous iron transport protein A [Planctomycetales bacterium]
MTQTVALASLPKHTAAVVRVVGGARSFRRRMMELGLVPGTAVVITNVAPLGDPLELLVRNCRLSIRRAEAEAIQVLRPEGGGAK